MKIAGQNKTGVVAFDCQNMNTNDFLISFPPCILRRRSCKSDPSETKAREFYELCSEAKYFCPYNSYDEYLRDIKFKVVVDKILN